MDTEKLKQFILPIVLIILLIAGIASLIPKIIENYQTYSSLNDEITNKTTLIQEKQTKIQSYGLQEDKCSPQYSDPRHDGSLQGHRQRV